MKFGKYKDSSIKLVQVKNMAAIDNHVSESTNCINKQVNNSGSC